MNDRTCEKIHNSGYLISGRKGGKKVIRAGNIKRKKGAVFSLKRMRE